MPIHDPSRRHPSARFADTVTGRPSAPPVQTIRHRAEEMRCCAVCAATAAVTTPCVAQPAGEPR
jgi:hypothetical protein